MGFFFMLFFLFCRENDPKNNLLHLSLQTEKTFSSTSSENLDSLSLKDPVDLNILFNILKPFFNQISRPEFAIRVYQKESGPFLENAYRGGVYDPINNQIVFVPWSQAIEIQWHRYDCATQRIQTYPNPYGSEDFSSYGAYEGGVYDPINQQIIFVPRGQSASQYPHWHLYDCSTQSLERYSRPSNPPEGILSFQAYIGGVYDPINQQIIFAPAMQASQPYWHRYDCFTKTVITYQAPADAFSSFAYIGGVYDPINQQIVFVPAGQADRPIWHLYDCASQTVQSYSHQSPSPLPVFAYQGGIYDPLNQQIIFAPYNQTSAASWHLYDCRSKQIQTYVHGAMPSWVSYGGVYHPTNNQIVFVPYSSFGSEKTWHFYDCETQRVETYPYPDGVFSSTLYAGGVYDPHHNEIILIPSGQSNQAHWHAFRSYGYSPKLTTLASHYLFNKL
jgi:hypothetical protein